MKRAKKRLTPRQKRRRKRLNNLTQFSFWVWLLLATHVHLVTDFGPVTDLGTMYVATQVLLLAGVVGLFFVFYRQPEKLFPKLSIYTYLVTHSPLKIFSTPLLNKHNCVAVIARYNEDIDWIRHLDTEVVIYNKGEADLSVDCRVIPRPNEGRESETYMRYIIDNYHSLPEFVIFLQDEPFDKCLSVLGRIRGANGTLELLSEAADDATFMLTKSGGQMNKLTYQVLPELSLGDNSTFVTRAQFIVPRGMIVSKSLAWWQRAYSAYGDFDAIVELPSRLFGERLNSHVFERIWPLIWEHSSEQEVTR